MAMVWSLVKGVIPTSVTEVRSFLGLAGYYRRFVEGFSRLALPLTKLMRKAQRDDVVGTKFMRTCGSTLREALMTGPISSHFNPSRFDEGCIHGSQEPLLVEWKLGGLYMSMWSLPTITVGLRSIKWPGLLFEMLYGRKCRDPICWDQVGERILEGPEMIGVTNEKVAVAREKLKEAQTRQKITPTACRAFEFPAGVIFLESITLQVESAVLVSR
ncbi:hypothetical protein Tco_0139749 [Tanacetum coccineum]